MSARDSLSAFLRHRGFTKAAASELLDAYRAEVLHEAANGLVALGPVDSLVSAPKAWTEAVEVLRGMADEGPLGAPPAPEPDPTDGPPAGFFQPGRSYSNQTGYTAPEQVWHFRCTEVFLRPTSTGGVWVAGGQVHKPEVPDDDWGPAWITNRDRFTEITEETGT